jgi:hypothetical protein
MTIKLEVELGPDAKQIVTLLQQIAAQTVQPKDPVEIPYINPQFQGAGGDDDAVTRVRGKSVRPGKW